MNPNTEQTLPEETNPDEPALLFEPNPVSGLPLILIGINVVVFILMAFLGAGIIEPDNLVILRYGANYGPLTLNSEYWRLLTCCFLHFGVIHLLLNMYALWNIGPTLELMLGTRRLLAAYVACGLLASVVSVTFQPAIISAGASGAVFGLYGLYVGLTARRKWFAGDAQNSILKNSIWFIGYNIVFGFRPNSGIDNAAHIGGLLTGLLIGMILARGQQESQPNSLGQQTSWAVGLLLGAVLLAGLWVNLLPKPDRPNAALTDLNSKTLKSFTRFQQLDSLGSVYFGYGDSSVAFRRTEAAMATAHFAEADSLMAQLLSDVADTSAYAHKRAAVLRLYAQCKRNLIQTDLAYVDTDKNQEARQQRLIAQLDSARVALRTLDSLSAR